MSLWTWLLAGALAQQPPDTPDDAPEPPPRGDFFERLGQDPSDQLDTGAGLLVSYGAGAGHLLGASFYTVVQGSWEPEGSFGVGMLTAAGGMASSWFYVRNRGFTRDQAALAWSSGAWGTYGGLQLARIIISPDSQLAIQRTAAATALSNVGATGLAMLFRARAPGLETSGLWLGAGLAGHTFGAGLGRLVALDPVDDRRAIAGLQLGGAALAGVGAWAGARFTGLTLPSPGLASFYTAQGAWLGLWVPFVADVEGTERQLAGAVQIGAALGAAASMGLAPLAYGHTRRVAGQGTGFVLGSWVGYGVSSVFVRDPSLRSRGAGLIVGALAGEAAGAWLGPRYPADTTAALASGGLSAWGLYQGIGWARWAAQDARDDADSSAREQGLFSLNWALGSSLGLALPALDDLASGTSASALSAGAWGSAYGHWVSTLARQTDNDRLRNMLLAGDAALITSLVATQFRPVSVTEALVVDGCGLAGATVGGLIGIAVNGEPRTSTLGATVGASIGLAGGTALALWLEDAGPSLSLDPPTPRRPRWLPAHSPVVPSVMAAPWFDDDGGTGGLVQLTWMERE